MQEKEITLTLGSVASTLNGRSEILPVDTRISPAKEEAQTDDNFRLSAEYRIAGTQLTQTPEQRRNAFLIGLAHPSVAPGGIEQMADAERERRFGAATMRRHREETSRRHSRTFYPQAYDFLLSVRRLKNTAAQIAHDMQRILSSAGISQNDGLISQWKCFPDKETLEHFEQLKEATHFHLERLAHDERNLALDKAFKDGLNKVQGLFSLIENSGDLASLKDTSVGVEDSENDLRSGLRLDVLASIVDIEAAFYRIKPQRSRKEEFADWHLDNIKALAQLGTFSAEQLLYLLLGEPDFSKDLSKSIAKSIGDNRGNKIKSYHAFYGKFGKILSAFIAETIGQVLFAFDNSDPVENWSRQDVERLKHFVSSRYNILHHIFEKLADKACNPLCGNLDEASVLSLAHETLRSSLYPDYRMEIRIGIGGTKQADPLLRACAYIIPALDIMQSFHAVSITAHEAGTAGISIPILVIVDGAALAVAVNGFDAEMTHRNGQKFLQFLKEFAGAFYPDIAPLVSLHHPSNTQVFDDTINPLLYRTARELLRTGTEEVQKAFAALTQRAKLYASENGGDDQAEENAIRYAAAHAGPEVFATLSTSLTTRTSRPVLKIGGAGEGNFDLVQDALAKAVFTHPDTPAEIGFPHAIGQKIGGIFMTVPIGRKPPYYNTGSLADLGVEEAKKLIGEGINLQTRLNGCDEAAQDMQKLLARVDGEKFSDFILRCNL